MAADVVGANATVGYYLDGTAPQRLEADVVAPLRPRKYEQIWLVGVSIGGLGSWQYTRLFPEHVDGILALAPFLGKMWSWLHNGVTGKQAGPAIYLGYADHDGLVGQDSVLAEALPADHVLRAPGVHDWASWRAMLEKFLRSAEFQRRCGSDATIAEGAAGL